jgi:hypothetical protein
VRIGIAALFAVKNDLLSRLAGMMAKWSVKAMKVKEAIEALSKLDGELELAILDKEGYWTIVDYINEPKLTNVYVGVNGVTFKDINAVTIE